jgi:hypothetical protein
MGETLWLNVGQINQHHVVVSSRSDHVGIFTGIDDKMVPQIYPAEPLIAWLNERASAATSRDTSTFPGP